MKSKTPAPVYQKDDAYSGAGHQPTDETSSPPERDTSAARPASDPPAPIAAVNPPAAVLFSHFLAELEGGRLNAELSDIMRALVQEIEDMHATRGGKPKGRIALAMEFKHDDGIMEVTCETKVTPPKSNRPKSVYWPTTTGGLTRTNPAQQRLPFQV